MCVREGYFMADVKDFSLICSLENVHIISRLCCFSDFSHHWKKSFSQAFGKLFQIEKNNNMLSVDNVYCRLKLNLKWNCDISTIFQNDSVSEPSLTLWIQPIFLNLLLLVVWILILTTKQLDSLRTQAELLFLFVLQGCDPEQEACKCFLMISCGLRVLPAVIVKGLFSVSVFLLLLFVCFF